MRKEIQHKIRSQRSPADSHRRKKLPLQRLWKKFFGLQPTEEPPICPLRGKRISVSLWKRFQNLLCPENTFHCSQRCKGLWVSYLWKIIQRKSTSKITHADTHQCAHCLQSMWKDFQEKILSYISHAKTTYRGERQTLQLSILWKIFCNKKSYELTCKEAASRNLAGKWAPWDQ